MNTAILSLEVRLEHDVVLARQRARQIAGLLGFEAQDQTRIATAVSESRPQRLPVRRRRPGRVSDCEGTHRSRLLVRVSDQGPGIRDLQAILEGRYRVADRDGRGPVRRAASDGPTSRRVVPGAGTTVVLGKVCPAGPALRAPRPGRLAEELARRTRREPVDGGAAAEPGVAPDAGGADKRRPTARRTRSYQHELILSQLNRELADTNRGVVALYAELDEKADYLRRASEMKSRFLSNMSHEFRTPLNSILSLARHPAGPHRRRTDAQEQEKQVRSSAGRPRT